VCARYEIGNAVAPSNLDRPAAIVALAYVRFEAHYGPEPDIAPCPFRADIVAKSLFRVK
jgi:hypothetical protein